MNCKDEITIDGVKYIRETAKPGKRAVIVVDRGWIFAGDVEDKDGRIKITRAVWVFKWATIGFAGVLAEPKKADIRKLPTDVDLPADAEVFRCPVADDWGL